MGAVYPRPDPAGGCAGSGRGRGARPVGAASLLQPPARLRPGRGAAQRRHCGAGIPSQLGRVAAADPAGRRHGPAADATAWRPAACPSQPSVVRVPRRFATTQRASLTRALRCRGRRRLDHLLHIANALSWERQAVLLAIAREHGYWPAVLVLMRRGGQLPDAVSLAVRLDDPATLWNLLSGTVGPA